MKWMLKTFPDEAKRSINAKSDTLQRQTCKQNTKPDFDS